MFHHRIQDGQHLPHTGGLLGLSCSAQPPIKRLENRIVPHRHQGPHVQDLTHHPASAPNPPLAAPLSAVPRQRGDTDQGRDLSTVQSPQLRKMGQQRRGEDRPHARNRPQQKILLPPDRTLLNPFLQPHGNSTSYSYDVMDRLETRTDPLGLAESYQYQYDGNGNLMRFVDRKGWVAPQFPWTPNWEKIP